MLSRRLRIISGVGIILVVVLVLGATLSTRSKRVLQRIVADARQPYGFG
jgi:hypothetical protein